MPNTKMDDESGTIQSDGYVITEVETAETDTAQVVRPDGAGRLRVVEASPMFQFFSVQLENPNSADWAVNALAKAAADSNNAGLTIRAFDDTTEEGVGFQILTALGIHLDAVRARIADPP